MNRFVAQAVALAFLAGCGGPPAVPALQPAPAPAPTGCLRADLPRLVPVARFQLPGKHHRFSGRSVQVSADGTRVALGSDFPANGSLTQVWQLAPRPNVLFTSPTCYAGASFALSPSGGRLITSSTGSPEAFDVNAGESLGKLLDTHQFCDAFLRDDGVAVWAVRSYERSKHSKGKVFVWDVVKNADAGTFEIADNRFSDAFPARNGAELWLFRYVGRFEIECYDVTTKKLARSMHPESHKSVTIDNKYDRIIFPSVVPDGSTFAAHVEKTRIYDGSSGRVIGGLPADVYGLLEGLLPGGTRYLARTTGNRGTGGTVGPNDLVLLDWKAGRGVAVLGGFSPVPPDLLGSTDADPRVGLSADGMTAVVVSKLGEVLVFDLSGVP